MYEAMPSENGALVDAHSSLLFTNSLYALSAVLSLAGPGYYALLEIPTGITTVVSYLHHGGGREVGGLLGRLSRVGTAGNLRAAAVAASAGTARPPPTRELPQSKEASRASRPRR